MEDIRLDCKKAGSVVCSYWVKASPLLDVNGSEVEAPVIPLSTKALSRTCLSQSRRILGNISLWRGVDVKRRNAQSWRKSTITCGQQVPAQVIARTKPRKAKPFCPDNGNSADRMQNYNLLGDQQPIATYPCTPCLSNGLTPLEFSGYQ